VLDPHRRAVARREFLERTNVHGVGGMLENGHGRVGRVVRRLVSRRSIAGELAYETTRTSTVFDTAGQ
jgi:hypothetical protein